MSVKKIIGVGNVKEVAAKLKIVVEQAESLAGIRAYESGVLLGRKCDGGGYVKVECSGRA